MSAPANQWSDAGLAPVLQAVKAPSEAHRYSRALITGNVTSMVLIERQHGLFGYPPNLVSIGLRAIDEGMDAHEAIDAYLAGEQP